MGNKLYLFLIGLLLNSLAFYSFGCGISVDSRQSALPHPAQSSPEEISDGAAVVRFVPQRTESPPPNSQGTIVDEQHAWVAAGFTDLRRTSDGGRTWHRLRAASVNASPLGAVGEVHRVYFITSTRGWLDTSSGTWQTEEGGSTWRRIFPKGSTPRFADMQHGWINVPVTKSSEQSYVTEDGGQTWRPCGHRRDYKGHTPGNNAYFLTPRLGWTVTGYTANRQTINGVARTNDGGCHWQQLWTSNENPDETYGDIYFLNEQEGWLAGAYLGNLYHTTDGGRTWDDVPLPTENIGVLSVHFTSANDGWIITALRSENDTGVYRTTNGGRTWRQLMMSEVVSGNVIPAEWEAGRLLQMLYAS